MCRFRLFFCFPFCETYKSKLSVTLEPVPTEEPVELVEPVEQAVVEEPIPEVEEVVPDVPEAIPETVQPKKRGRPKAAPKEKAKKPVPKKAVIMKPPSESSDDDKLNHDDMETLLLDYLVKRKTSQQNARRQMWSQLAGLS